MFGLVIAEGVNPLIPSADRSAGVFCVITSQIGISPVFLTASLILAVTPIGIYNLC
jgi:hypothetical protein